MFHFIFITQFKSQSDDIIKPYSKSGSSPSPYLNQQVIETNNNNHKSKKCTKAKKLNKKHSTTKKKTVDSDEKDQIDKGFNSYATTISSSENSSSSSSSDNCSVNTNNNNEKEKENEKVKSQLINNTVKASSSSSSSDYVNVPSCLSVVEAGVQTQLTNDETKTINSDERKYVEELKVQLDSLRSEIGRLQDAQSNLEKSLKTQAAFRPILLSDFDGKTGM